MGRIKKYKKMIAFVLCLAMFSAYVIMDTFFITRVYGDETGGSTGEAITQNDDSAADGSGQSSDSGNDQSAGSAEDDQAGNQHSGSMGGPGNGEHRGKGGPGSGFGKGPGKGRPGSKGSSSSDSSSDESASGSSKSASEDSSSDKQTAAASFSSGSYSDDNIKVTLKEYRENDTTIYVADVQLSDSSYLKTALAQGTYGKNVTAKTSETAESVDAVLAVNGDYYGAQDKGYVIRNGKLYRDAALANQEDLVIYKDGHFGIINESKVTAQQLIKDGAVQLLSFGPALVQNGSVSVTQNEEVGMSMASNPRTAIGIIDENHYVFVVSDGRSDESEGLSLYELAQFMDGLGVKTAYNLDGGGSSTMYFKGSVVNKPTTGGNNIKERSVSDIVYIG